MMARWRVVDAGRSAIPPQQPIAAFGSAAFQNIQIGGTCAQDIRFAEDFNAFAWNRICATVT
jgi:hypothetical protein